MPKRGRGGFGGPPMGGAGAAGGLGGGGSNAMMKQFQKMQEDMAKAQEALATETVEIEAGGGLVKIVMSCQQRLQTISINKEALDLTDDEWLTDLQDIIGIAVNQAIEKSQERAAERMEAITGGLDLGGLGGLLG